MRPEPMRLDGLGRLEPYEEALVLDEYRRWGGEKVLVTLSVREYARRLVEVERLRRRTEKAEAALRRIPAGVRWVCTLFRGDE